MICDGKIGEYTLLSSMQIGGMTIFLCENQKAAEGEKYGCGFAERNDFFERYTKFQVSDEYLEIVKLYGGRICEAALEMEKETAGITVPLTVIGKEECYPNDYGESITGKVIAIRADVLLPEYQRADRQIYLVKGGFGAEANARGRAVYCTNLHTGEDTRFNREDVQGVIRQEYMPAWAVERLDEIKGRKEALQENSQKAFER